MFFFIDFYRKMKKFGLKKYKIIKKLKTLPISRNFVICIYFLVISCFRTSKIHLIPCSDRHFYCVNLSKCHY